MESFFDSFVIIYLQIKELFDSIAPQNAENLKYKEAD